MGHRESIRGAVWRLVGSSDVCTVESQEALQQAVWVAKAHRAVIAGQPVINGDEKQTHSSCAQLFKRTRKTASAGRPQENPKQS